MIEEDSFFPVPSLPSVGENIWPRVVIVACSGL